MPHEDHSDMGLETLRRMSVLDGYNRWVVSEILPYVGNIVLEVGSGIGNLSPFFLDRKALILTDVNDDYLSRLGEAFRKYSHVTCERYDLEGSGEHLRNRGVDTIIALNVLEHIVNDVHALSEMAAILVPGGRVILQLPAHGMLYGSLDRHIDHHRRYSVRDIREKLEKAGFVPEYISHFNMFGAVGWFVCSRILKKKILPEDSLTLFNVLTPLFAAVERVVQVPFGLSVIAVGRKKPDAELL